MQQKVTKNWVTIGTGVIANELAVALESLNGKLYGVANRTYTNAVKFAEKYGIEKVYNEIDEVFTDPTVDIIYISTPHNTHIHYLKKALAAGKHVLCEKAITLNSEELEEALQLAKENNVVLAESRLPEDTTYTTIEGGNHSGFGLYGQQNGDGTATMTAEEQQKQLVQLIKQFIVSH